MLPPILRVVMSNKYIWLIVSVTVSFLTYANDLIAVSENALSSVLVVSWLLKAASFIIAAFFLTNALIAYREHRQNPKFVPLDKVIILFIISIVLFLLPFLSYFSKSTALNKPADVQQHHRALPSGTIVDIDEPL